MTTISRSVFKLKELFGLFTVTEFEKKLLEALKDHLSTEWREILDSQFSEFNQTARLIGPHRGEAPPFGHTSFYKNIWGKSSLQFSKKFPVSSATHVLATLDVVESDNKIRVQMVLVRGIFFTIEYRSPKRFVPIGRFVIENVKIFEFDAPSENSNQ